MTRPALDLLRQALGAQGVGLLELKKLHRGQELRDMLAAGEIEEVLGEIITKLYGDHPYLRYIPQAPYTGPIAKGDKFWWEPHNYDARALVQVTKISVEMRGPGEVILVTYRMLLGKGAVGPHTCDMTRFRAHVEPDEIPF